MDIEMRNFLDTYNQANSKYCESIQEVEFILEQCNGLNFINQNIRSVKQNFDRFCVFVTSLNVPVHVIILTETWNSNQLNFELPGYRAIISSSHINIAEGVSMYVRNDFVIREVHTDILQECNSVSILFSYAGQKVNITAIYKSHDRNVHLFLESLERYISNDSSSVHILSGDINIDILSRSRLSDEYLNIMSKYGMVSYINNYTRSVNGSNSCLDHIFARGCVVGKSTGVIYDNDLTDHFVTFGGLSVFNTDINSNEAMRNETITVLNYEQLLDCVKKEKWESLYLEVDVNIAVAKFHEILEGHIRSCTNEFCKKRGKSRKIKAWITSGVVTSIRNKDKIKRTLNRQPFNADLKTYFNRYRNLLNLLIKKLKNNYFSSLIAEADGNIKSIWETIKIASNTRKNDIKVPCSKIRCADGSILEDQEGIANSFNNFFVSVGPKVLGEIEKPPPSLIGRLKSRVMKVTPVKSVFMDPVRPSEIEKYVQKLKTHSSYNFGIINNRVLKHVSSYISEPLAYVFNLVFSNGIYPDLFKKSIVVPIFKSGEKDVTGNYRPISLTLALSKVLEKCIKARMVAFLDKFNIISKKQFGFQKKLSTDHALFQLNKLISQKCNEGFHVLGFFLDISKAFDCVQHDVLLNRLYEYGIRGLPLKLLESYLTNRTQVTRIGEFVSGSREIVCGVPQGTVLGPLLFLIYINELMDMDLSGRIFGFADDTAIIFWSKSFDDLISTSSVDFQLVRSWLDVNYLRLNLNKTSVLKFSVSDRKTITNQRVRFHDYKCAGSLDCSCNLIPFSKKCKYLGVIIDDHLKFTEHIGLLIKRLRKLFYVFKILRRFLNFKLLKMVYFGFFNSLVRYGILVWGCACKSSLRPLQIVQNTILRIILNKPSRSHTAALYERDFLRIKDIFLLESCLHVFRTGIDVDHISQLDSTRTASRSNIRLPKINLEVYRRNSYVVALNFFYDSYTDIRKFNNIVVLKRYILSKIKEVAV